MLIIISIIGYLMGTIPGAFILVKLVSGKDIRDIGTGNVGAMNSYDVTNKKWIGIAVFFIDLLKGILAVCIAKFISHNDITAVYLAGFFSVLGHNFNIFLINKIPC